MSTWYWCHERGHVTHLMCLWPYWRGGEQAQGHSERRQSKGFPLESMAPRHMGPPSVQHPGVPLLPARMPARQQAGRRRRGSKPSFHILPVSLLCHTFFFSPIFPLLLSKRGSLAQRVLNTFAFPRQAQA